MLYDSDAVPNGFGSMHTTTHMDKLVTVLMAGTDIMRNVDPEAVRGWGVQDPAEIWELAIRNSVRLEAAQVQSFAPHAPDIFAVMSSNRVAGTLLSVSKLEAMNGPLGCMVSYPHKDMFFALRFNDPDSLDIVRFLMVIEKTFADRPASQPQELWWAKNGQFERLRASIRSDGNPAIGPGPRLRAALGWQ